MRHKLKAQERLRTLGLKPGWSGVSSAIWSTLPALRGSAPLPSWAARVPREPGLARGMEGAAERKRAPDGPSLYFPIVIAVSRTISMARWGPIGSADADGPQRFVSFARSAEGDVPRGFQAAGMRRRTALASRTCCGLWAAGGVLCASLAFWVMSMMASRPWLNLYPPYSCASLGRL